MDILEARKKAKKKKKKKEEKVKKETPEVTVEKQEKELPDFLIEKLSETAGEPEEKKEKIEEPQKVEAQQTGDVSARAGGDVTTVEMHEEVIQDQEREETFMELAEEALEAVIEKKEEKQFLTFSIGEELFAVEINNIREIIRPRQVTPVPGVDRVILGIVSVRGNIMPVVDVALKIGMRKEPYGPEAWDRRTRFIIFAFNRVMVAMVVESVKGVISAYADEIEPTPTTSRTAAEEFIKGIIRKDSDIYSVVNVREVFDFIFEREEV